MNCEVCGETDSMSYTCSRCGDTYCVSHRLPESHECIGLAAEKAQREAIRAEGGEIPWFEDESEQPLSEGRESANQNSQSDLWPNTVLLVLITLLAVLGFGYLTLSFLGGVL